MASINLVNLAKEAVAVKAVKIARGVSTMNLDIRETAEIGLIIVGWDEVIKGMIPAEIVAKLPGEYRNSMGKAATAYAAQWAGLANQSWIDVGVGSYLGSKLLK